MYKCNSGTPMSRSRVECDSEEDIGILLVGHHAMLTDSIAARLRSEARFSLLGIVRATTGAVEAVAAHRVDVLLMDIDTAETACFKIATEIRTVQSHVRIIFISAMIRDRYVERALQIGARGFLLKDDLPQTIVPAILEAIRGGASFPEEVRSRIVVGPTGASIG
ncbi:MAG: response regulator transcription factor [Sedimentisphaerales bacterium]|nr:response regulator transcription factor [Sedimentisphaerales bacterium]